MVKMGSGSVTNDISAPGIAADNQHKIFNFTNTLSIFDGAKQVVFTVLAQNKDAVEYHGVANLYLKSK